MLNQILTYNSYQMLNQIWTYGSSDQMSTLNVKTLIINPQTNFRYHKIEL